MNNNCEDTNEQNIFFEQSKYISKEALGFREFLFKPYNNQNDIPLGLHYHDFYEFQIYTYDAGTINICDQKHEIHRGDIVMIKIFEPHEFIRSTSEGYRYCVTIDADFLLTACSSRSNLLNIFSKKNPNYPFGHVNEDILQQYLDIANRYFQIIIKPGYDIYEKAILYELLATMYNRFYSESVIDNNDIMDLTVIVKLIQYINSNLNKQLSLDELADVIHFSKFYLCKQFKRITGYTLKKYIIGKRIHKAKLMLMDNIPISNISLELGFNNYSHFYKTFLQTEGISPSDYRIQLNKDHS